MSGKALLIGALGVGAIALIAKKASSSTSTASTATPAPTTKVDQTIAKVKAKVTPSSAKVDKAKGYVAKGTAEAQAAIDAVNRLLK
jgi:hypothetical protein